MSWRSLAHSKCPVDDLFLSLQRIVCPEGTREIREKEVSIQNSSEASCASGSRMVRFGAQALYIEALEEKYGAPGSMTQASVKA